MAEGRLTVRTESQAGQALFAISNTGPRIAPDQTERLFEPFQRLDATRTGGHAHQGLGLSIVRAIATAHDATLSAESRPDGGLTVTVCFARPPAAAQPAPSGGRQPRATTAKRWVV